MIKTVKLNGKDFYISYMGKDNSFVIGTYNESGTKKFKVDLNDLNLEEKEKKKWISENSKFHKQYKGDL